MRKNISAAPRTFPARSFKLLIGRLSHPPSTRPDHNRHGGQQSADRGHNRPPGDPGSLKYRAAVALARPCGVCSRGLRARMGGKPSGDKRPSTPVAHYGDRPESYTALVATSGHATYILGSEMCFALGYPKP